MKHGEKTLHYLIMHRSLFPALKA